MSTTISSMLKQVVIDRFGESLSRYEAKQIGIDRNTYNDSDIDQNDELDIDDEVLENEDLCKLISKWYEEEQSLVQAEDEENGALQAVQGAGGSAGA